MFALGKGQTYRASGHVHSRCARMLRPPSVRPSSSHRAVRHVHMPPHVAPGQEDSTRQSTAQKLLQVPGTKLRLLQPHQPSSHYDKIMVFLPGTDGTGQSILPHVRQLHALGGYCVFCLILPPDDRSGWDALTRGLADLLRALLSQHSAQSLSTPISKVTLFGESFGGILALKVADACPSLIQDIVLLNPATCFADSLAGLSSFVSSTNLLRLFPPSLYKIAQATLLPFLVDRERLSEEGLERMCDMIEMLSADSVPPVTDTTHPYNNNNGNGVMMAAAGGSEESRGALGTSRRPRRLIVDDLTPHVTAGAANHRANLMREGGRLPDSLISSIHVPVLLLSSARDRMLPSVQEGARLERLLPCAQRIILPDSGHAALLEQGMDVMGLLRSGEARRQRAQTAAATVARVSPLTTPEAPQPATSPPASSVSATSNTRPTRLSATRGPNPALGGQRDGSDLVQISTWDEWSQILAPWRDLVSPVLLGFENLPPSDSLEAQRPMLFVGNHQRIGFYDTPLLVYELAVRGYRVRGLAHPGHWDGPVGPFFSKFGAVKASPIAAYKLLKSGEKVLLFPGGAKEVSKAKGSEYQLFWKEEPDFVRLAAKCNAIIVPFAAVGADDAYDVIMDPEEVLKNPVLGPLVRSFYSRFAPSIDVKEAVMPLTGFPGLGVPTLLPVPNLNRLYFKIAKPIDTAALGLNLKDTAAVGKLYTDVRTTVEQSIAQLLEYRAQDESQQVGPRLSRAFSSWTSLVMNIATRPARTNSNEQSPADSIKQPN